MLLPTLQSTLCVLMRLLSKRPPWWVNQQRYLADSQGLVHMASKCAQTSNHIHCSVTAIIPVFHTGDRGSIPRNGIHFCFLHVLNAYLQQRRIPSNCGVCWQQRRSQYQGVCNFICQSLPLSGLPRILLVVMIATELIYTCFPPD
ncbi:hypothetical protein ASPBRDRAFT_578889 [Aspergillus brasiliensis CBS 101740]|uniref:Uncharacterized protein n=1 Tax=Aspergillus brasiliensis (strain CBS 101740 / IMI 381727 / IBT 21946) TaxID=767769 RepID=A0A1L9UJK4_ASPBC|nr:hypothetical protein ASPBRDRAFT_578889 [Aspergillus brasiliensis CBS 101740]